MTPVDPFLILALPPRFDLTPSQIRAAYLTRAAAVHPDSADHDPAAAAELNQARAALDDPERRADALLMLLGGPSREQERSLPAGFLAEIMELRERIDSAMPDADPKTMSAWRQEAQNRRTALIATCSALFNALTDPPSAEALRSIRIELNAWRYFERLIEQLDPAYDPTQSPR